jgi:hypothetical protein
LGGRLSRTSGPEAEGRIILLCWKSRGHISPRGTGGGRDAWDSAGGSSCGYSTCLRGWLRFFG